MPNYYLYPLYFKHSNTIKQILQTLSVQRRHERIKATPVGAISVWDISVGTWVLHHAN
jgi:hypothetical protein